MYHKFLTIYFDFFPKDHILIGLQNGHCVLCEVGTEVSYALGCTGKAYTWKHIY